MEVLHNNLLSIRDFRTIVDLDMLGKYLAHCAGCNKAIDLRNSLGFRSVQVTGMLLIACVNENCMKINQIPLTPLSATDGTCFVINEEFNSAMKTAGIKSHQIKTLFALLQLPLEIDDVGKPDVNIKQEVDQEDVQDNDLQDDLYDQFELECEEEEEKALPRTQLKIKLKPITKKRSLLPDQLSRKENKRKRGRPKKRVSEASNSLVKAAKEEVKEEEETANEDDAPDIAKEQSSSHKFSCPVCDKPFMRKSDMIRHEQTHSGLKPFICSFCQKSFTRKATLDIHLRFHTGDRPYSCGQCGKHFVSKARQRYHMMNNLCKIPSSKTEEESEQNDEDELAPLDKCDKIVPGMNAEESLYVCGTCCHVFHSQIELQKHKVIHRKQRPYTCTVCNKTYFYVTSLHKHMSVHTGQAAYACGRCPEAFVTKRERKEHQLSAHGLLPHVCTKCDTSFDSKQELKSHIEQVHPKTQEGKPQFECVICTEKFQKEIDFRIHLTSVHFNQIMEQVPETASRAQNEEVPSEEFASSESGDHLQETEEQNCSPLFTATLSKYNKLFNEMSGEEQGSYLSSRNVPSESPAALYASPKLDLPKTYTCPQCNETFTRQFDLKRHQLHHFGLDETYTCDICGKKFNRINSLKVHISAVHIGERPFQCSVCGASFKRRNALNNHKFTHVKDRPFKCTYCTSSFIRKEALEEHTRVHTREKPFICTYCGKAFPSKKSLKHHERYHTGEKLYPCRYCERRFARTYTRCVHERTHTGEKPYQCSVCSRCFSLKKSCEVHERKCIVY